MALLWNGQSLAKSFGARTLFESLSVSIFSEDRIGLIGVNGCGKSTFLKILAGQETPDRGTISPRQGLRIGYLPQSCDFPAALPQQILLDALPPDLPDYEKEQLASMWLSKLGFSALLATPADQLSGGWKKRLALARELMLSPDLLLLDEPTNHLDLEGILWLEKFLAREAPAYLLVSHDRTFLQHTTNRIIEIGAMYPNGLFTSSGTYLEFLARKEAFLAGQIEQERSMATKMRRETDWLRQGAKARTTKSRSRIEQAHEIQEGHAELRARNQQKRADIQFSGSERQTQKLLVAKNLAKGTLFKSLDLILSPGSRLGLMGANGSGKTTLLRLMAGEITPDMGTIKQADALKIVYFDQHRVQLPLTMTLRDALSPRGDYVFFREKPIHVNGWCKRFLFSPDVLDLPLSKLSGGERARIAIAHLMLQPADLLLLDEPTNDLDIPTLEILEESLTDFPGAVVLITHDRSMLDRICTSLLALGNSEVPQFFADFAQWQAAQAPAVEEKKSKEARADPPKRKLSYNEKKEYDQMEAKIARQEAKIQELTLQLEDPAVSASPERLQEVCAALSLAETHLEQLYLRWEELGQLLS